MAYRHWQFIGPVGALTAIGSLAISLLAGAPPDATAAPAEATFPPVLPGGKEVVTDTSPDFLKPPVTLRRDVKIAKTPPTVEFMYLPGQEYPGKPWSAWGDSLAINGKYYTSIGDHLAPAGNSFVYEYDPATKKLRQLLDVRERLRLPEGHYTPGKIHGRLDMGEDGWLYFSTHRGSTRVTTDEYHYTGDWILRVNPETLASEIVARGPVPKHCIPNSVLDPKRLIFYGGTAPGEGDDDARIQFFAYDVKRRKLLYSGSDGPSRYMAFVKSTGRVYYVPGKEAFGPLMWYDPEKGGPPVQTRATLGLRAATEETPQGYVYTVSQGRQGAEAILYAFDPKTEAVQELGTAGVGTQSYITTLDADPTGRYLYYMPGAHGGSERDGTPIVQFDVKTRQKKVIAFLHPFYRDRYGCTPVGTYSAALDPKGDRLYVTWNVSRGGRAWDCTALTVIHIPESERPS